MRFFIDTEFNAEVTPVELISIGIAAEDGRTYYAVSSEYDPEKCSDWVKRHVFPKLGNDKRKTLKEMREDIYAFVDQARGHHEFWGYYADWDWFLLAQNIMGGVLSLPERWPLLCLDVKQYQLQIGATPYGSLGINTAHNALGDAIWTKDYWCYLEQRCRDGDALCGLCGDTLRNLSNI